MTENKKIKIQTPARAGILGNPSDGFYGKTIAIPVRNFHAEVAISESNKIEILPGPRDKINFDSLDELINDIKISGYYGGFRLIKAALKQFHDFCKRKNISLADKNFSVQYTSNIPRQVGLAGSSAIITSTIKGLSKFYKVKIDKPIMANRVLWAETFELGIAAGLQDRVVQVYNEPVFMDFNKDFIGQHGYGIYEPVDIELFPPLFLAYRVDLTHEDRIHNDVRTRWERGEPIIRNTMIEISENASKGYEALKNQNLKEFDECINRNFDLRARIYPITDKNNYMIRLARAAGATAKFPGSGGAIIGSFNSDALFNKLEKKFGKIGCKVVRIKT